MWGSSLANGVIGFDDITLFDGGCSSKTENDLPQNRIITSYLFAAAPPSAMVRVGECRFERDICDWMNATSGTTFWKLATVARRPANLPDKTFGAPGEFYLFGCSWKWGKGPGSSGIKTYFFSVFYLILKLKICIFQRATFTLTCSTREAASCG